MKKLLWMQKFMETEVERKFDISKGNFVIREMTSFSYFSCKATIKKFIKLRKLFPTPNTHTRTHKNEGYCILLLRHMDYNAMENLPSLLKEIKEIPK